MNQAETFASIMHVADSMIDEDDNLSNFTAEQIDAHWNRFGDSFRVAREEFHATLINVEDYPSEYPGDIITTWKFSDDSIVYILGDADEQGQPFSGSVVLLPGQSEFDVIDPNIGQSTNKNAN